ncbi:MAG: sigma-70 family RNA polymerase sigma factor [Verrucomicrobiales bacterium]|nr:sigma-70 family RNA polymerase sigma factor [Verrucomicrobiales bacterium]
MAPGELATLYDAHAPALYAYLLNLMRSEADACDLLQELFVRVASRPGLLEGVAETRGFLIRLAHHAAVDAIRQRESLRRAHAGLAESKPTPFVPATNPDEAALQSSLALALGELPEEQRAVVHLKLWEDYTFEAIAELLGLSPNTAASRYRYAMEKLRARLRPLYDEIR